MLAGSCYDTGTECTWRFEPRWSRDLDDPGAAQNEGYGNPARFPCPRRWAVPLPGRGGSIGIAGDRLQGIALPAAVRVEPAVDTEKVWALPGYPHPQPSFQWNDPAGCRHRWGAGAGCA